MTPKSCEEPLEENWRDVVHDYLELKASLGEPERDFLIHQLQQETKQNDEVKASTSFTIGDKAVLVCKDSGAEEYWVYFPKQKKIQKQKII